MRVLREITKYQQLDLVLGSRVGTSKSKNLEFGVELCVESNEASDGGRHLDSAYILIQPQQLVLTF